MVYTLRFFLFKMQFCFIILTYLVPVLFTFYIQSVLKLKKYYGAKRLKGRGDLDCRTLEEKIMCLFRGKVLTVLVLLLIGRLISVLI